MKSGVSSMLPLDKALLVRIDVAPASRPLRQGVNQRLVQRIVMQRANKAVARLMLDDEPEPDLARAGALLDLARQLTTATPHTFTAWPGA